MTSSRWLWALGLLPPLLFALYTGQVWEDFFIAYRHSANLCAGAELSFQEGQRIQGFSSPLAVLLGAAACAASGSEHGLAIDICRAAGLLAYAFGLVLLLRSLQAVPGLSRPGLVLGAGLYLLEVKAVAFSVNGMETGFVLGFLAGCLAVLSEGVARHPYRLGLCWAGLLWSRPDGCVLVAATAVGLFAFPGGPRRPLLGALLRAAALCTALYLPWLLFAWVYYGSPVPLTVLAKQSSGGGVSVGSLIGRLGRLPRVWADLFLPPYAGFGGWDAFTVPAGLLGALGCAVWLGPRAGLAARRASLMALLACLYLALLPLAFPWYFPPAMLLTVPPLAALGGALRGRAAPLIGLPLLMLLALGLDYARLARVTTELLESGHRQQIGLWLRQRVAESERVYLECPGRIGFASGVRILDYPGLVSPEVLHVRSRVGDDLAAVGMELRPEWLVLRPEEAALFQRRAPGWLDRNYELARSFDVRDRLRQLAPEHPAALYDAAFLVLRRR